MCKEPNTKYGPLFLLVLTLLIYASETQAQSELKSSGSEFVNLFRQSPEEKIFIHTAKTFYLPGEIIWFKLYVTDPLQNHSSLISKVAYAELLDTTNKPVLQAKIALDSGSGNGSLVVPSYLSTGQYILRAYTNLMKNYDPDYYFHQVITVMNPSKTNEPLQTEVPASYHAGFFAEGGQLVGGLRNTVAFKFEDQQGMGIQATGILVDQQNDTIVHFIPLKFGMGRFSFTPGTGNSYKALITYPGYKTIAYPIPEIIPKGFVIHITETDSDQLKVDIQTNTDPASQQVYLVVHAHKIIRMALALQTSEGRATFVIDKKNLPEGISFFTVFNKYKEAVAERLYFKRPSKQLHVSINTDRKEYDQRAKIISSLSSMDANGKPVSADLSIAVFLVDSLQSELAPDVRSYFWMGSEIKGIIESPDYYFTASDSEVTEATDNLMLIQGWRKLLPNPSVQKTLLYIPEYAGHIITGRIIDKRTGLPAKDIITYLSVPGERFHFSNCRSDEQGRIYFDCKKIVGTENIIVQTNRETDSVYQVEIDNPFSTNYVHMEVPSLSISEKWKQQVLSRITSTQVQNAFTNIQAQPFYLPNFSDTTPFFGKPDKTYLLDDYTRFYTMEEVMREYVPEVQVRKSQGNFKFKMLNRPYNQFFENNPLVLLDGVPVFDINKIIAFDPLKIKKLDLVARRFFQGAIYYNGIASYNTYQGDLAGFQMDPNALIIEYAGLQLQRQFYSPQYEGEDRSASRIPDFRNLLYWSPDIKTGNDGMKELSFYSSDLSGNFVLIVQGISAEGAAVKSIQHFTVIKKNIISR